MSEVAYAFERTLEALKHDPSFANLEIVQHAARPRRGAIALSVTIDCEGGVNVGLCERVAGRINDALETFEEAYTLEVESAGLERPLVRPADYERFAGKRACVITTLAIAGAKTHRGILLGLRGETVILQTERGELPLPVPTIKSAHLEYDPRADLTRDKIERKKPWLKQQPTKN